MSECSLPTVFVVDPDPQALEAVAAALSSQDWSVRCFPSAAQLLDAPRTTRPHCVIAGHRLGDWTGLQLQQALLDQDDSTPVVIHSGQVTIALTVEYMQKGAVTVLEKPCPADALLGAASKALRLDARCLEVQLRLKELKNSEQELTGQERRVMESVIGGKLNKVIANDLNVSVRTIEKIRARILRKFRVGNATELAAKATELQLLTERVIPLGARALNNCFEPRC